MSNCSDTGAFGNQNGSKYCVAAITLIALFTMIGCGVQKSQKALKKDNKQTFDYLEYGTKLRVITQYDTDTVTYDTLIIDLSDDVRCGNRTVFNGIKNSRQK